MPPPATFRLQGLVTLLTVYSLQGPADLVSCRRRSWDCTLRSFLLPRGSRSVSATAEPTCHFPCRLSRRRSGRPAQQVAASGLSPSPESLATTRGLTRAPLAAPLGFFPSRGCNRNLAQDFARDSSHALGETHASRQRAHRHHGVSLSFCRVRPRRRPKPTHVPDHPRRVLAPIRS